MAVQIQGNSGTVAEVETNTRATRVALRPGDYGSLGVYMLATNGGTFTGLPAADSELWQFRSTSATNLMVVKYIAMAATNTTAAFAAAFGQQLDLFTARSFTAAGTGGATATITGNNAKLRTSMGTTTIAEIRTATTAALGVGTKTLDAQPIASLTFGVPAALGTGWSLPNSGWLFNAEGESEHPIVLAQNEGLVIRNHIAMAATGTWIYSVTIKWAEYASY